MLETASAKIDRFGWDRMDVAVKDQLCADWCDVLSKYKLEEVADGIRALFRAKAGNLRSINEYQVEEQIKIRHRIELDALRGADRKPEPDRDFSPEAVARRRALGEELVGKATSASIVPATQSQDQTQKNINEARDQGGKP